MSLSAYLLSKFAQKSFPSSDAKTLLHQYQILSIIYINLFILISMLIWKFYDILITPVPGNAVIIITFPFIIASLGLIRVGKEDYSAFLLIGLLHTGNYISSHFSGLSVSATVFLAFFPAIVSFLTSSYKVHGINLALCFLQNFGHLQRISMVFKVTLTAEQEIQITGYQRSSYSNILLMLIMFYMKKSIETSLWTMAELNYQKAENITKEVVQAMKSKDTFISSLSHEIRNPLNSINASLDYLLKEVKENVQLKILNSARMSFDILLNLLNNALDAAKLKSDNMEICYMETSPSEIVKRVIGIYGEILQEKGINAQALYAKNLPAHLWLDSSRLIQIIINLLSNVVKFTQPGGKLRFSMSWFNKNYPKEALSQPIKELLFEDFSEDFTPRSAFTVSSSLSFRLEEGHNYQKESQDSIVFKEFDQTDVSNYHNNNVKYLLGPKKKSLGEINLKHSGLSEQFSICNMMKGSRVNINNPHELPSSPQNSQHLSVIESKQGYLKIQISDTGDGIPEENLPNLFGMFERRYKEVASVEGGIGLGLWICKQLCQKMGGDINVFSKPNKGTTFVIYIPVDNNNIVESNSKIENQRRENIRALVVDDYAYNRDVHQLILEKEGVEVTLACDGAEAVEKFKTHDEGYYNFILMDVQMPVMNGFVAAEEIRKWEKRQESKKPTDIYFVSGEYYSEDQIINELKVKVGIKEENGIRCLRKPIDVTQVKNIVQKYKTSSE